MRSTKSTTSAIFDADSKSRQVTEDLFSREGRSTLHECFWAEANDGLTLPVAIRPALDDAEGLFAEIATYFPSFVPVTAYARVLSGAVPTDQLHLSGETRPELTSLEIRSAVGLIVGELLTASAKNVKAPAEHVSYGASRRTLAYAVYRSAAINRASPSSHTVERWLRLREIVGMESPIELAASIAWITSLQRNVPNADKFEESLQSSLADVVCGRRPVSSFGKSLASSIDGVGQHIDAMRGPFDERAAAFDKLVRVVIGTIPSGELGSIYIAYFCNEILAGSLSHFGLLAPLLGRFPTVVLWYGLFASLSEKFEWNSLYAGLGLKVARDLVQPFSLKTRPTCDISFEELEVLSRLTLKSDVLKPEHPRVCSVELWPGVEVLVRIGIDDEARAPVGENSRRAEEDARRDYLLKNLLLDALDLLSEEKQTTQIAAKRTKRSR